MRAGRPWALVALLLLAYPCFADQADDLLATGKKAFGDGHYSLAVQSFRRIAAEFPESAGAEEGEYLLGVSLFYEGSWGDALETLTGFRTRHPRSLLQSRVLYWMGAASLKLGRFEEALKDLRDRSQPGDAEDPYRFHSLLLAGVALEALGRDPDAAEAYTKILSDKAAASFFPEATYRLAGARYRSGQFGPARDLYQRVLMDYAQSPFVQDAVFFLAECELALGAPAEAEKRYRTVLSLYPASSYREAATFRLADAAWRQGRPTRALARLAALQTQFPGGAYQGSALRLAADIELAQKKYQAALDGYGRALGVLKDESERQSAWYSMGVAQLALGMKSEAAESFTKAGAGSTSRLGENAAWERALLFADAGNDTGAIPALQAFLRTFPASAKNEQARRLLASLLEKTGNQSDALTVWDSLVKGFPGSAALPEYLFRRGSALLSLDRQTPALDDFQRVERDFPRSPWRLECAYSIGYVYNLRGEYPRALPYFQSVAQDPSAGEVAERSMLSAGICLFNMGSFEKAIASLQALRARKPKTVREGTIVLYMGRALYRGEKLAQAAQRLAEAATLLAPPDGEAAGQGDVGQAADAAEALYWLGWSNLRLNRLPPAKDAFLAVAERFPASPRCLDALFRAGVCETMQGNDGAAIELFERVLAAPGSSANAEWREQALYEQAWALRRQGRLPESQEVLATLAREFPTGMLAPQAFFKVAEQALQAHEYGEAQAGFQKVARDFPGSALAVQALYWSGETARQSGDQKAALEGFWACIAANPPGSLLDPALVAFRATLKSVGSIDLARQYAQKARDTKNVPAAAVAGAQLSLAAMLLPSAPEEALALINDVRRRAPPEPLAGEASLALGQYYASTADWPRAMEIFTALEGSRADEIGARAAGEHGRALESTGHTSEAVDEFLKLSYQFPDFPDLVAEALYNAVRISRARGEQDRAAKIEQGLRKAFPASPWLSRLDAE